MVTRLVAASAAMHVLHDRSANLQRYRAFIEQASRTGARLVVFPEGSLQGFFGDTVFDAAEAAYHREHAEPVPGYSTDLIARWAQEHNLYIVFGMFELSDTAPVLHNTAVMVGPEGYIGKYRKIHQPVEEHLYYQPGSTWNTFDTAIGTIGLMICYDQSFPEAARELALRGANLLVVPNAWANMNPASINRYDLYGRARAAENRCPVIQSNQVGKSDRGDLEFIGNSRIIDPDGFVIASTPPGEEGLATAEITLTPEDQRQNSSTQYLRQRHAKTYTLISRSPAETD